MSTEIIKVFDYIGEKMGIAIDWTQENIMPYLEDLVQRFVKLNIIEDMIWIIVWGVILITSTVFGITVFSKYFSCEKTKNDGLFWSYCNNCQKVEITNCGFWSLVIAGVALIASIVGVSVCTSELIKWIYIPEFQIAEEISYMIQTMGGQ